MISKSSNSTGFAILYAVLMVSIVLTISLTLLDISYKQLILSSINKESKLAYYAAVSALNCVTYWDKAFNNSNYYPFGSFDSNLSFISANKPIRCADTTILISPPVSSGPEHIFTFTIEFDGDSYAEVKVIKTDGVLVVGTPPTTRIKVDGYSTSDLNNPRRVQRSLDSS